MKKIEKNIFFRKNLLKWHKNDNNRVMPWKMEQNPYKIWLSEIILQQTRVEQGLEYYNKFVDRFSTINELALANEQEIFKMWEGLGYYSRCKNLIATARFISFELKGVFPTTYDSILQLKGVGPYTAAAIASFAYNLSHAVVDGNVLRVLSRFYGNVTAIDSTEGKKGYTLLAQQLLGNEPPALYNQAIMDFGATVCKPKLALCNQCVLNTQCIAFKKNIVGSLPLKEKKINKTSRYFNYIIAEYQGKIYVKKREQKDIWQNLWEFILIEEKEKLQQATTSTLLTKMFHKDYELKSISSLIYQKLTHQSIEAQFIHIKLLTAFANQAYVAVNKKQMKELAFPRLITKYLEEHTP
jgi:A/G-specific adenine glycosylase